MIKLIMTGPASSRLTGLSAIGESVTSAILCEQGVSLGQATCAPVLGMELPARWQQRLPLGYRHLTRKL